MKSVSGRSAASESDSIAVVVFGSICFVVFVVTVIVIIIIFVVGVRYVCNDIKKRIL